jgi:hypothetical protein
LDGNVVVEYKTLRSGSNKAIVKSLAWDIHDIWAHKVEAFKITDQRYKPADTSYLDKPDSSLDNDQSALPIAIADAMNAAVAAGEVEIARRLQEINKDVLAELNDRKAKAERKRVVDAAFDEAIKAGCVDFGQWLSHLYDKGFLRLPE